MISVVRPVCACSMHTDFARMHVCMHACHACTYFCVCARLYVYVDMNMYRERQREIKGDVR